MDRRAGQGRRKRPIAHSAGTAAELNPEVGLSNAWMTPPIAKQTAPANVPQLTRAMSSVSEVAGRTKAASPARKKSTDPNWLTATTHQSISRGRNTTCPAPTSSMARCPETRKQMQPRVSGSQIQSVGLPGSQALREGRDEADREQQRPDEQDDSAAPGPVVNRGEQDREPAAEAEEDAPDQVGDVHGDERRGADARKCRSRSKEGSAEEERDRGDKVHPFERANLSGSSCVDGSCRLTAQVRHSPGSRASVAAGCSCRPSG